MSDTAEPAGTLDAALAHARGLLDEDPQRAAQQAGEILKAVPGHPGAQLILGAAYRIAGQVQAALAVLEPLAGQHPRWAPAHFELGIALAAAGRTDDAILALRRALLLAPGFDAARYNYATLLSRDGKADLALPHVERLLAKEPRTPAYRILHAVVLANLTDYGGSIRVFEDVLRDFPRQPKVWVSYGHSLKTVGRQADSIAAYRRAIALAPSLGEAWWSLANLKTVRFSETEVQGLRSALARSDLAAEDRVHLEFALARALEDQAAYEESFAHYTQGNAIRRRLHPYSAEATSEFVQRARALMTSEFFAARAGSGVPAADPIFIVGLPRSGSTLLDQILASHTQVEGTMELPDMEEIAREIADRRGGDPESSFLPALAALTPQELRSYGERYLGHTRLMRRAGKPFFIDKMPNNWLYVGLIQLILPNARIIDARRHPLGCCLSCFKQHFARGQTFTYGLEDLGHYYRDYVALMAHFDSVLPGRVHRVFYEDIVTRTETEVRRLLQHCALAFEPGCLRFYENERAVRTASSEQVRRPIFRDALEHWQHYECWLDPLKAALGAVLPAYPAVPESF